MWTIARWFADFQAGKARWEAGSAKETLEVIQAYTDLIIVDINMPGVDGYTPRTGRILVMP
jgi:CheY-like chemotaxis protein